MEQMPERSQQPPLQPTPEPAHQPPLTSAQKLYQQTHALLKETPHTKITLLYLALAMVLPFVVRLVVPDVFFQMAKAVTDGNMTLLQEVINQGGGTALFLSLLLLFYGWVMNSGYKIWALSVARRQERTASVLLEGFGCADRVVLFTLIKLIFYYLWTLLALSLFMLVLVFPCFFLGLELLLVPIFPLALISLLVVLDLRYRCAIFFLLDKPSAGIFSHFTKGINILDQDEGGLFRLYCSFWRWYLLWAVVMFALNLGTYYPMLEAYETMGGVRSQGDLEAILMVEGDPIYTWVGVVFGWVFALQFLPRFHLATALYYEKYRADVEKMMND